MKSWLLFGPILPFLTSLRPRCLAVSHQLPSGACLWSLHPLRADLAMVAIKARSVGGRGLPDSAVTPFDTSPESRSHQLPKVWRMLRAADVHSATSPPVFTAGLVGLIRADVFLDVTGIVRLRRNLGFRLAAALRCRGCRKKARKYCWNP